LKDEVLQFLTERLGMAYGITEMARELKLAPSTVQEQVNRLYNEGKVARTKRGLYVGFRSDNLAVVAKTVHSVTKVFED
jgi:DNA-binding IclR family transcriptional regulator